MVSDNNKFCFESEEWFNVFPKNNHILLTKIFRQDDIEYKNILINIRKGIFDKKTKEILEKRKIPATDEDLRLAANLRCAQIYTHIFIYTHTHTHTHTPTRAKTNKQQIINKQQTNPNYGSSCRNRHCKFAAQNLQGRRYNNSANDNNGIFF